MIKLGLAREARAKLLVPVCVAFSAILLASGHTACATSRFPVSANTNRCSALVGFHFGPAMVKSASIVVASDGEPEYCKVLAYKMGKPVFEMQALLPSKWGGDLVQQGVGGMKATLPGPIWNATTPLQQEMALIAGNGGNNDSSGAMLADPEALRDWSYRSLGPVYEFGQSLIKAYYGVVSKRRYFVGCSGGGLDAIQAAANYPDNYDGIISQAPAYRRTSFLAIAANMNSLPQLSSEQWNLINERYIAHCDELDGLKDGIVSNPGACNFDPTTIASWSEDELRTIRTVFNDIRLKDGTIVARKLGFGPSYSAVQGDLAKIWGKYVFAKNDPTYDPVNFDLDRYWSKINSVTNFVGLNVDPIALGGFLKQGKKIIFMMGLDDTANTIYGMRDYYDEVRAAAGNSSGSVQLRWMTGLTHCGAGNYKNPNVQGPDSVEMLGALRDWVEKGITPTTLVAYRKNSDGSIRLSRPVCEAGHYASYKGSGDPNEAENFACVADPKAL